MSELIEEIANWSDIVPTMAKFPITAYKNRYNIQKLWKQIQLFLGAGKTEIAVVGRAGVGKTVLVAQLTGTASSLSYQLPGMSTKVETELLRVPVSGPSKILRVVPGQEVNTDRLQGLDEILNRHDHLEGLIYVTNWGYTLSRDPSFRATLLAAGVHTVEDLRRHVLEAELFDFENIVRMVKQARANGRGPKWLLVAVNKVDLFWDRLGEAEAYYGPDSEGPFSKLLKDLLLDVGRNNIQFGTVPVSAWPEVFAWDGETIPTMTEGEAFRRHLLFHFLIKIAQLS